MEAIYHPLNQHIPYSVIFSRHVLFLDQVFFDAAKGNKLALEQLLSRCERSVPSSERVPDYFEEEFRVISQLGEGTFGHVYHVKSHTDGAEYALKKTRKPFLGYRDGLLKMSEVEMLLKIGSNPWCVQLVNAWVQSGYIYMQMELCPGGNLSTMLDNYCRDFDKPLPEETVWKAFADICLGLQHIHDHNVVHLDIKPENIFVGSNGTFKIGDFGMATKLPVGDFDKEGDRVYLAPEVLAHQQIDYCADIFSLGLLVLEMASNIELPDNGLIWKQLRTGPLDELIPSSISASLRDLIKCMLHPDPHSRPSSFALLQHPILRSFVSHQVEPNLISSHSSSTSIS
ncbi:kinase-like domain-containing protein [Gorgonomyces haynaldii]|nr:kinase-like domain-containing protein [Gorgonomyces haynaldii]